MNWKTYLATIQKKSYLFIGVLVFLLFILLAGGTWSYLQHRGSVKDAERIAAEQARARKINEINAYYLGILAGAPLDKVVSIMLDINKGRMPLSLSGFNLENYKCDLVNCIFSFTNSGPSVFNVQELKVFGGQYKANISEKTLEYSVDTSPLKNEVLTNKFNAREKISVPGCSELVNYIHSFNSLIQEAKGKFMISGYPSSSISSVEGMLPEVKDQYGFLHMQWNVVLPDNLLEFTSFLSRQAYKESFVVNKIEKKKPYEIEVTGNLLCAN
ncbi:pilus assembly protein [Escherichia coli]|uniref:pilus assembly protein n=1 Tax=Escherichia coli TaxID=562 RepID=UPI0038B32C9F